MKGRIMRGVNINNTLLEDPDQFDPTGCSTMSTYFSISICQTLWYSVVYSSVHCKIKSLKRPYISNWSLMYVGE